LLNVNHSNGSSESPRSPRVLAEALPDGWRSEWSEKHKTVYFYHVKTGRSQWERPVVDASHEPDSPPPPKVRVNNPTVVAAVSTSRRHRDAASSLAVAPVERQRRRRSRREESATAVASTTTASSSSVMSATVVVDAAPATSGHELLTRSSSDRSVRSSVADDVSSAPRDSFRIDSDDDENLQLQSQKQHLQQQRQAPSVSAAALDFHSQNATEDSAALRALRAADDAFAREQTVVRQQQQQQRVTSPVHDKSLIARLPGPAVTAAPSVTPHHPKVTFADDDKTWELTKVNRKVSTLAAERDRVMSRLLLAQEGYNDVDESIDLLQTKLTKLNDELAELQQRTAQLTVMRDRTSGSEVGADNAAGGAGGANAMSGAGANAAASGSGAGSGAGTSAKSQRNMSFHMQRLNARLFGRTHSHGQLLRSSLGTARVQGASNDNNLASAVTSAASSSESVDFDESESSGGGVVVVESNTAARGAASGSTPSLRMRRLDPERLKRDLGPLDPRLEIYSSAGPNALVRNRSNSAASADGDAQQLWWRFDHEEAERARRRAEQFERVLSFVKPRRNLVLRLSAISRLKKLGDEPSATIYEGVWGEVRVIVRRLKSPTLAERGFLAEVRSLQRVQHAGVQMCLGVSLNPLCVVAEFMPYSLYDVLHRQRVAIDMPVVVSIGRQLAEALKHLHSVGIVHRDLNSFNVLCDDNRQIKIGGFRFASTTQQDDNNSGGGGGARSESPGTPFGVPVEHRRWQAPELTRGSHVDEKADVWSFGMVMWEMVSQEVPFAHLAPEAVAIKVAFEGMRPTPPEHCPTLLRELIRLTCEADIESRVSVSGALALFDHIEGRLFFGTSGEASPVRSPARHRHADAALDASGAATTSGGVSAVAPAGAEVSELSPNSRRRTMELIGANSRQFWSLKSEQEAESRLKRQARYDQIIHFLNDRNLMIDYNELRFGERLGEGSFSVVYKAWFNGFPVAVKKLKNTSISHRFFLREVSMLWRARHRSVVLFMGATAQPPCIVTVYMAGGSLYDALHVRRVRIDTQLALSMACDLADAMRHLHALNVLHRDFTSRNVLLDDAHNAYVADFGLSREATASGDGMTIAGVCNPRWRPPELTRGSGKYSAKVDVYSFALVMFELFAMQVPFGDLDGVTAAAKAAYENLRPVLPLHLPAALRSLIAMCWSELPASRPDFVHICRALAQIDSAMKKAV
jgi:serine/threonine protein kinase